MFRNISKLMFFVVISTHFLLTSYGVTLGTDNSCITIANNERVSKVLEAARDPMSWSKLPPLNEFIYEDIIALTREGSSQSEMNQLLTDSLNKFNFRFAYQSDYVFVLLELSFTKRQPGGVIKIYDAWDTRSDDLFNVYLADLKKKLGGKSIWFPVLQTPILGISRGIYASKSAADALRAVFEASSGTIKSLTIVSKETFLESL